MTMLAEEATYFGLSRLGQVFVRVSEMWMNGGRGRKSVVLLVMLIANVSDEEESGSERRFKDYCSLRKVSRDLERRAGMSTTEVPHEVG